MSPINDKISYKNVLTFQTADMLILWKHVMSINSTIIRFPEIDTAHVASVPSAFLTLVYLIIYICSLVMLRKTLSNSGERRKLSRYFVSEAQAFGNQQTNGVLCNTHIEKY